MKLANITLVIKNKAFIEKWEKNLDDKGFGHATLIDLSKACDILNDNFLFAKLNAYGSQHDTLKLIYS